MRVITSASAMYIELNKKMQHNEIQENGFIQRFIAAQILIFFLLKIAMNLKEIWMPESNFEEDGEILKGKKRKREKR